MARVWVVVTVFSFAFNVCPALAQTAGGERTINVEGHLPDRDAGPRGEPGGRSEGSSGRSDKSAESSSPTDASASIPTVFFEYDVGSPPLPPPGFQVHKVQYGSGSYDVVSVHQREGTYSVDHYSAGGTRIGGDSGNIAGYPGGIYNPVMHAFPPPPPPSVWTCYTPAGPIRVNNPMVHGDRCVAIVPYGTFYGTAGSP
jgi:hypothetical protein